MSGTEGWTESDPRIPTPTAIAIARGTTTTEAEAGEWQTALRAALPGYEHRPGQLAMSARIARALEDDARLLVEAGTGTGKTMAYLIPAILSGRKVVISTATRTLQDQIATLDLPRLAAVLGRPFRFAVMKGLGNYVCRRRLELFERQTSLAPPAELVRLRTLVGHTRTGDRAEVADLPDDDPTWGEIASSPETRLGHRCVHHDRCFVTAMRRAGLEADVVVTNHHLFFADLALRDAWPDAAVLPPYEAVVFDEAHRIEDIAAEFFGIHFSTQRLSSLARDLGRARAGQAARTESLTARLASAGAAFGESLRAELRRARTRPGAAPASSPTDEARMPVLDELWNDAAVRDAYFELDATLEEMAAWLDPDGPTVRAAPSEVAPELAGLSRRAGSARRDLSLLSDVKQGSNPRNDVRWLVAGARGVGLHAAPIDVGPRLAEAFARIPGAAIFTSATLTVGGSFAYVRGRLGLEAEATAEARFASPFRYNAQALLYLAADLPEPNRDGFVVAAARRIAELCRITGGRALVLFTSFRHLRGVAAQLRRDGMPHPMLVQGEGPRHALLDSLRQRIGSVLLATQSFWEGVDVPGEALSLVVIDRLPFGVPDDPVTAARMNKLRDEGLDPFGSYQLPRASLALKQGFGRLIRSSRDVGIVALLDGRILRRGYGGVLLASLPPECPRTESLADVEAFWSQVSPQPSRVAGAVAADAGGRPSSSSA